MTEREFKYQVIADDSGKFCGNGVMFDTFEEARDGARDLMSRWMLVREWRILRRNFKRSDEWDVVTEQLMARERIVARRDKPEQGKQYRLTGGHGDKSIANGDSWTDSEVPS
jgi:hypothetical protein